MTNKEFMLFAAGYVLGAVTTMATWWWAHRKWGP